MKARAVVWHVVNGKTLCKFAAAYPDTLINSIAGRYEVSVAR
jgi:hypothetical protein